MMMHLKNATHYNIMKVEKPFYDTNVKIMKNVWYEELCVP